MADVPQIVVFHDDHEVCDNQLKAAQATIRSLTAVVEQAEAHVEDRDQRLADLAEQVLMLKADNSELRKQRDEYMADVERLDDLLGEARQQIINRDKDVARLSDEVARLNATIVRLACHRVGLHNCGGEWKNHDHAGDEQFPSMGSGLNSGGED